VFSQGQPPATKSGYQWVDFHHTAG